MEYLWEDNLERGNLNMQAGGVAYKPVQHPHEAPPKPGGLLQGIDGGVGENWLCDGPSGEWHYCRQDQIQDFIFWKKQTGESI